MKINTLSKVVVMLTVLFASSMSGHFAYAGGLTDFKNAPKKIEDFTGHGKWLLVMFWASDCHICNKEAYQYVDFHLAHSDGDATVLGISADGKERFKAAEGFIKKHKIDFPNLIGEPEDVAAIYSQYSQSSWVGTPSFLLFNPKGEVLAAQVGAVPPELIENFIKQNTQAAAKSQSDKVTPAK